MREHRDHYQICKISLKCTKCDQLFDKLHTYHGYVNIRDGLDKFKCSNCGLCFVDKKKAYNHMYNCRKKLTVKGVVCCLAIGNHY